MRKYLKAETSKHEMILNQLGAKVQVINSLMCYVSFDIDGTKVSYVYNVNKKNEYFLERVEPYPQPAGTFRTKDDVIETITIDIEQFKNAKHSRCFDFFVDINKEITTTSRMFEDLFLYYNVSLESMENIKNKIMEIKEIIEVAKENSERVYDKKNPKSL